MIGYLPGPYPDPERFERGLRVLKQASISCVEIGIPDAVPQIEGTVIAECLEQLRDDGWDPEAAMEASGKAVRAAGVAGIAVLYPHTVRRAGPAAIVEKAAESGFAAVLVPGAEAALRAAVCAACTERGLDSVAFVPADAAPDVIAPGMLCSSDALIYLQTVEGPTGSAFVPDRALSDRVSRAREAGLPVTGPPVTGLPVALGFGIKNRQDAEKAFALGADVVVVGTAIVEAYREGAQALSAFLRQFAPLFED
jgi:tryptophan synthase alpha chain